MRTFRNRLLGAAAMAVVAFAIAGATPAPAHAQGKTVIESAADLPRFAYRLDQKPSAYLADEAAAKALLDRAAKDAAAVLEKYEIKDRQGRDLYRGLLRDQAIVEKRWDDALKIMDAMAAEIEKPSDKLTAGLLSRPYIAAERAGGDAAAKKAAFRKALEDRLKTLPWEVVQDSVKATKGQLETFNPELIKGAFEAQLDKIHAGNPEMGFDVVRGIIGARMTLAMLPPYREEALAAITAYIAANDTSGTKANIWAARDVTLPNDPRLSPVVVAVWDSGVDTSLFDGQWWANAKETANGKDDDGNGFVDDVHGIAFDLKYQRTAGGLNPLTDAQKARTPQMLATTKGALDLQANLDTPEAQAFRAKLSSMKREEVPAFIEEAGLYSNYIHGTHVAGIAAKGNPAARLLHIRNHWPTGILPPAIDETYAAAMVKAAEESVAYMKANGVRVVNMSWRITRPMIEGTLAANNIETDPKARAARADKIFGQIRDGLTAAFKTAPEILFVAGAGNEDQDINFAGSVPAGIDLPNVVTVGAVDQAGEETGFTSVGASVDLHANGFQVDSLVPGGTPLKLSGTSMAAPQVTNLAAKLFAAAPALTAEQALELIRKGADPRTPRGVSLINPKKTFQLASGQ